MLALFTLFCILVSIVAQVLLIIDMRRELKRKPVCEEQTGGVPQAPYRRVRS